MLDLIEELENSNISVSLKDNNLEVRFSGEIDPDLVSKLKAHKEELISFLKRSSTGKESGIPKADDLEDYPVSHAQKRIWLQSQLEESSKAYHIFNQTAIQGECHIEKLQLAVNKVVGRHEVLRIVFRVNEEGDIRQHILKQEDFAFTIKHIDLKDEQNAEEKIKSYIKQDNENLFRLDEGPLMRMVLFTITPESHILYYNIHHIITDGWSMNILEGEILWYYDTILSGRNEELPPLRIQYKDYTMWQKSAIDEGDYNGHKEYWLSKLSDELPRLGLPSYTKRPLNLTHKGDSLEAHISPEITKKLKTFCTDRGGSLYMGILATLNILLYKYTAQKTITLGSPSAGREDSDLENQIGFYVNTLVLRNDIDAQESFADFFEKVKKSTLDTYKHQIYPFDLLVKDLNIPYNPGRNPIFDFIFTLHNTADSINAQNGIVDFDDIKHSEDIYCLTDAEFHFREDGDFLTFWIKYNTDLYTSETIKSLITHFKTLLNQLLDIPFSGINTISCLTEEEIENSVALKNNKVEYPHDKTLVDLFEEQVAKNPDAVALTFDTRHYTYDKLNTMVNQMTHYIRGKYTVNPNDLITVQLERNEYMVVTLLAILKSGGAYIPIDPEYPSERIEYIRNDSQAKIHIDSNELNRFLETQNEFSSENPVKINSPKDLAYIIYTSGTTGQPKGVMIEHANVIQLLASADTLFHFDDKDVWTMFHSYCFDFSVWEMYGALLKGSELVVIGSDTAKDPDLFLHVLRENKVTVLNQTPSAFYNLAKYEAMQTNHDLSLRYIIFGGEALSPAKLQKWFETYPEVSFINMYGITETTVHVTYKEITEQEIKSNISNIGIPLPTLSGHILDQDLNAVPVGVPGELCVAGAGLARGYLNKEDLTKEKFIKNPFHPDERLYRSGDLARILPNGEMEYIGRKDTQVKVRGYRIELGEIESTILKYPSLESVLVTVSSIEDQNTLIAYLVSTVEITAEEIRNFLEKQLPLYMIPHYFIVLDSFPVTSNGKIDKSKLPQPQLNINSGSEYVAPRTELEKQMSEIFGQVVKLPHDTISINDSFFIIGGDSIKVINLIVAIRQKLNINLTVPVIYANSTIKTLTEWITENDQDSSTYDSISKGLLMIEDFKTRILQEDQTKLYDESAEIYPVTFTEKGMIYSSQMSPLEPVYYDQFIYNISIENVDAFKAAINELIDIHPILRTKYYTKHFIEPAKVVLKEITAPVTFEELQDLSQSEKENRIKQYILEDLEFRYDFDDELLWKWKCFQIRQNEYILIFSFHHAMLDGWSVSALRRDLANLLAGKKMEKLKNSYKEYCALLLGREEKQEINTYWKNLLNNYSRNKLPYNYTGNKLNDNALGAKVIYGKVPDNLLADLVSFSKESSLSLKSICLSAYAYLLQIISNEKDIVTGTVSHNRPDIEDGNNILGCFLNTLPYRADFTAIHSVEELLQHTHQYLIDVKSKEIHLSEIAHIIGEKTGLGNPVFDTLLNFTDFHSASDIEKDTQIQESDFSGEFDIESNEMTNTLFDFEIDKTSENLLVKIKYSKAYFSEENMYSAIGLYIQILQQFITKKEALLSEITTFTQEEYQKIITEYNDTAIPYDHDTMLNELFENQAQRTPHNVAVRYEGNDMTYAELNDKANKLAHYLISLGVEKNEAVGLLVNKGFDMVMGMLAILKIGGSYVPIDPDYPLDRQKYIIKNSGISKIITNIHDTQIEDETLEFVNIQDEMLYNHFPHHNVGIRIPTTELAYTIYTSGSTGLPKGVMIEHHGVVNLIKWVNESFHVGEKDRLLLVTSMCFDLSVYDIFGILSAGGTLVIAKPENIRDIEKVKEIIVEERITFWDSVPSTMGHVVTHLESGDPFIHNDLRLVFLSGDWIPAKLPNKITKFFPNAEVISLGGATECTVWSNYYHTGKVNPYCNSIPYGKPFYNSSFYILNDEMQPTPEGVAGNLYIGGVGVARGYANDPEKSRKAFVNNPFSDKLGSNMYYTGDLGRWLPDGNIEFLGRKDHQVKIRGFRIELGEIENTLLSYGDSVTGCVVDVRGTDSDKQIVAYYVCSEGVSIDKTELRSHIQSKLPEYMVPSFFVELERIPLTSNGKIDRKSLPQVGHSDIITKEYTAPQTPEEHLLVGIWEDVLKLDKISIHDNFFDLGGNSLIVAQVINRIEKQLGSSVSFRDFFTSPTISELCSKLVKSTMDESIPVIAKNSSYEVSPSQRRLWVLSQLEGGSKAYNMPVTVRLRGVLDTEKFKSSFELLLARHEILRTYFKLDAEGSLHQYITDSVELGSFWEEYNSANESDSSEIISSISSHVFDLSSPYLFRLGLIKEDDSSYLFTFTIHHILSDGWSLSVLINDLISIYNSLVSGEESGLSPLSIQYKDYAHWLNKKLSNNNIDSRSFWHSHLEGELPVLQLPSFKKRPVVQTYNGSDLSYVFSGSFLESLEDFGKSRQSTLFMVLMAGVKALLRRYSGQDDIIVGSPIAGRDHAELENQIGLYLNTLALRTRYDSENSFESLLLQERDTLLKAYQYQDYPFDRLIDELSVKRDISRSPLFDVMVVLQNQQQVVSLDGGGSFNGFEVEEYAMEGNTAQFDLSFNFSQHPEGLSLNINYNTDIYERSFINSIFIHLEKLLTEAISSPDSAIERLDYLSEEEEQEVLEGFNKTACNYETEKTIIDLFEEQCALTPDSVAVIYEDQKLSYKELNERSNRLSHYILDTVSVEPEDLIAVKLERSSDLIVTLLAILKSGCAYVPIDPSYPSERIAYIENNSGSKLTIDAEFLSGFESVATVHSANNPERNTSSNHLAYVIYTSGTTGNPKGVMIEHGNVINLLHSFSGSNKAAGRSSLTCNYNFDVSVLEIFDCLLSGSALYVPSQETVSIPSKYADYIVTNHITRCYFHPMFIEEISTILKEKNYTGLEKILIGVEPIRYKTVDYFLNNGVEVINGYGPTETTVCCTFMKVEQGNADEIIPIGKPTGNTHVYILDAYHRPVGIGMTGELYIAGAGLARGYLKNEALTEEKFLPNPFSEESESLMYHTGDLGRWLPDGNIEFLGRKDHQVKIRGFRIELGEIENTILGYGDHVTGCVVDVRGTGSDKQLVAYYVCSEDISIDKTELRAYLQSKLPEYMVPSFFVELESIPLTSNGKIDRKSLPQVGHSDLVTKEYTAPVTQEEHLLVGIWKDVLKLDKISIHDNFFELGGNSIHIIQIISRVFTQFNYSISIEEAYSNDTIFKLAKILSERLSNNQYLGISVAEEAEDYPLSFGQKRIWLQHQIEEGQTPYNMRRVLVVQGKPDYALIKNAVLKVMERQSMLRTVFIRKEDEPRQKILTADEIEFSLQIEELNGSDYHKKNIDELIVREDMRLFDLENAPLFNVLIISTDRDEYILSLSIHHIISDGWSMNILSQEFALAYNKLIKNEDYNPPKLEFDYKDFTVWQNKYINSERYTDSLSYWQNNLNNYPLETTFSPDRKRPENPSLEGSAVFFEIPEEVSQKIIEYSIKHGITLYTTLIALYFVLLYEDRGQKDLVVGSPVASRNRKELENIIGFFLNTILLRSEIDRESTLEGHIMKVKEAVINAMKHQEVPFDTILNELKVPRQSNVSPLFQTLFVLQNTPQDTFELENFVAEEYPSDVVTSKLDITFNLLEVNGTLAGFVEYSTELYDQSTIELLVFKFKELLKNFSENSRLRISDLHLLGDMIDNNKKNNLLDKKLNF